MYGAKVRLQRHTKVFRYVEAYGEKNFSKMKKCISAYCAKYNEPNICHLDIQKHVSYEKWFKYYIFFLYSFTENMFLIHNGLGENF